MTSQAPISSRARSSHLWRARFPKCDALPRPVVRDESQHLAHDDIGAWDDGPYTDGLLYGEKRATLSKGIDRWLKNMMYPLLNRVSREGLN